MLSIRLKQIDWILVITMLLILVFGLVMIYSTTINAVSVAEGRGAFRQQLIFSLLSLGVFFAIALQDYRAWSAWRWPIYLGILLLLVAADLLPGTGEATHRWIRLGGVNIQPSEFAKLAMIVVIAAVLSARSRFALAPHYMLSAGLLLIAPTLLVLYQPDLGTALMFGALWFGMMFAVGVGWRYIGLILVTAIASIPIVWNELLGYQQDRVRTFLDPTRDPTGAGYNVIQAMIAHGSGGVLGVGLGQGTQSQYKFLPVRHTDFIYSVISEELGLIGTVVLLLLFGLLLWRVLKTVEVARDNFGRYLCLGVFIILFAQVFVNIGMNMGLLPVTGIPLPFVSYGGSSLLVSMSMLAVVASVGSHRQTTTFAEQRTIQRIV